MTKNPKTSPVITLARLAFRQWKPPPDLTLSQWADDKFYLSAESSAEPGKWRTYPYQREPMDTITDPKTERITFKKSARVGYTKIINCAIGYHIEQDPCPQLVVQPTIDDAQGYSKDEVAPMIRDCPCLSGLVADAKTRDSNNTIGKKAYPGGVLTLIGANSARGFRRLTVRNIYFDEINGYPPTAGNEGDQIALGIKRTDTYWNRKIVMGSTDTIKGMSRIEDNFNLSDKRFCLVPCPTCKTYQALEFKNLTWPEDNPERAYFKCISCKKPIDHRDKRSIIEKCRWKATADIKRHAGFFIWAAYSYAPAAAWGAIAKRFLDANHYFKNTGDFEKLKTVVNTDLGESWEERGQGVDTIELTKNKSAADPGLSDDVLIITAGVDVQDDRIELEVVGWAGNRESWSLDWVSLPGDPDRQDVWNQLDEQLQRRFKRKGGGPDLPINCAIIDHGHKTAMVEAFVLPRQVRRIYAGKGSSTPGKPIVSAPGRQSKALRKKIWLIMIGTDTAKDLIMGRLRIPEPGPGFMHFPDDRPDEYFRQLTAEEVVYRYTKGVKKRIWKKRRARNEALDLRVYATAALEILNPKFEKIRVNLKRRIEKEKEKDPEKKQKPKPVKRKKRGGYVHNW